MFKNNKGSIGLSLIAVFAVLALGGLYYGATKNGSITYNAGGDDSRLFGTTNYPTSLDSLTNPSATDSVATVSHSSQHANANDAIEALQAKLGIGASTATNNTVLYGNGTGSSAWSATPSLTSLVLSGQGQFGSFISNASSTIIGGLTITGNSTTTNATSTIGAFTNLATSTSYYGGGLTSCSGSNALTWSDGKFGCTPVSVSSGIPDISYAASNNGDDVQYRASTTSMVIGNKIVWHATCAGTVGQRLNINYRLSNHVATTTLLSEFSGGDSIVTAASGFFEATTTSTITVDYSLGSGNCVRGSSFIVTKYK